MLKNKNPLIILNWRDNVSTLNEIKDLLKEIHKEYLLAIKLKNKSLKKKPVQKDLALYIALPNPFIYPIQEYIKNNKIFKKILIGSQNFSSVEKQNKNNNITLAQIKNVGSKFVILNSDFYTLNNNLDKVENKEKINENISAHNIILDRLNAVSKKFKDREIEIQNEDLEISLENENLIKKRNSKELQSLSEKLNSALINKLKTIVILKDNSKNLQFIINIIKNLIKNLHYNLFDNLIIGYKDINQNFNNLGALNIENCQEKSIAIRRTIANLFGIDNAKKVKIIYEGGVDQSNIVDLLEQGGVDGVMLGEESLKPKFLARILTEIY